MQIRSIAKFYSSNNITAPFAGSKRLLDIRSDFSKPPAAKQLMVSVPLRCPARTGPYPAP